jgi:hypothetical protein
MPVPEPSFQPAWLVVVTIVLPLVGSCAWLIHRWVRHQFSSGWCLSLHDMSHQQHSIGLHCIRATSISSYFLLSYLHLLPAPSTMSPRITTMNWQYIRRIPICLSVRCDEGPTKLAHKFWVGWRTVRSRMRKSREGVVDVLMF